MDNLYGLSEEDIKVFLDEAEENLQLLDDGFLRLEQEGNDEQLMQEIFRAAHTLKGSSATLGHKAMAEVTHAVETILEKLRDGKVRVTPSLTDALLAGLDALKEFKNEIAGIASMPVDMDMLLKQLAACEQETAEEQAVIPEEAQYFTDITAVEQSMMDAAQGDGLSPYVATLNIDGNCPMPAVRMFQAVEALEKDLQVVCHEPGKEQIDSGETGHTLRLLLCHDNKEFIEEVIKTIPEIEKSSIEAWVAPAAKIVNPDAPRQADDIKGAKKTGRTVRVDVERLDKLMNLVGELVISKTQLSRIGDQLKIISEKHELSQSLNETVASIGQITNDLQDEIVKARMLPIEQILKKFPRMVRDLSQKMGKDINFEIHGAETELDRSVIEIIGDPLIHIIRNAVDHGIETPEVRKAAGKPAQGTLVLAARHEEGQIAIEISDDGRGLDVDELKKKAIANGFLHEDSAERLSQADILQVIFASGFSTAGQITDVSGRGVGMDIVKSNIEKLNGSVEISTDLGKGTTFEIRLPLTLAIIQALLVKVKERIYAFPLSSVSETIKLVDAEIKRINKTENIMLRETILPILRIRELFGLSINGDSSLEDFRDDKQYVVVVSTLGYKVGLVVDEMIGEQEIVVKSLGGYLQGLRGISGATILGDGSVALIVDTAALVNHTAAEKVRSNGAAKAAMV